MKFILTIDTEADNQWKHGIPLSTENIRYVPRFQQLCERYRIKPTYLVTSEVCEDASAKNIFKNYLEKGTAEIGAHLHSWTTPPFKDIEGMRFNDPNHPFANELAESLLDQKITNITLQIQDSFGIAPTSFRSGRFGFDDICAKLLVGHGYLVDSSVTPYVNWSGQRGLPSGSGGPNFVGFSNNHYFLNTEKGKLLEVPVTILPTKWPLTANESFARMYFTWKESLAKKIVRKLFVGRQPLWLRPYAWTTLPMLESIVAEANRRSLQFITMMFHSSELMAGCSPYRRNESEIDLLYYLLENFFLLLREMDVSPVTLTEAALELSRQDKIRLGQVSNATI